MLQAGRLRLDSFRQQLALLRGEHPNQYGGHAETGGRDQEEIAITDASCEEGGNRRAHDAADCAARRDEAEEALRLRARKDVRHEGPKYRDDEHVEGAHPDVETGRDPVVLVFSADEKRIE